MTSFQDAPDEIVRMSNNLRFVLVVQIINLIVLYRNISSIPIAY